MPDLAQTGVARQLHGAETLEDAAFEIENYGRFGLAHFFLLFPEARSGGNGLRGFAESILPE
jgi:hypothetical protein